MPDSIECISRSFGIGFGMALVTHIGNLKQALNVSGQKEAVFEPERLARLACPTDSMTPGVGNAGPRRSPPRLIYCTVLARSAKLPTPPWPPAMRSIWMPIFWTPFTSAVVPGLAGGICGAGLQMSVTKPSFASGM
jgi:hypothetical protein